MKKSKVNILYRLLQFLTLILLLGSFYLSYFVLPEHTYWYYFFLNIATELVVVLLITFTLEKALESYKHNQEEKKWFAAKSFAKHDIENLAKALATTVLLYTKTEFEIKEISKEIFESNKYLIEKLSSIASTGAETLTQQKASFLEEFKKTLGRDKKDLEATITLYKDVLPPHYLHPLWETRSRMNKFSQIFIDLYDLLKNPERMKGEEGRNLHEWIIKTCAVSFEEYVRSLEKLLKSIG